MLRPIAWLLLLSSCATPQPPARTAAPRPQAEPAPPMPPPPPEAPAGALLQAERPLSLTTIAELQLQPRRARRGKPSAEVRVVDVAFLPPDGRHLLALGGDGRARAIDTRDGATRWTSRPLGADARAVAVCGTRFWAATAGGSLHGFEWVDQPKPRVIDRGRAELGAGRLRGCFGSDGKVVFGASGGALVIFDTLLSRVARSVRGASHGAFDSQVGAHGWIALPGEGAETTLQQLGSGDSVQRQLGDPARGRLMQAHVVAGAHIVSERCDAAGSCEVTFHDFDGAPRQRHRFPAEDRAAARTQPSALAVSQDAELFAWSREGGSLALVETSSGRRAELAWPENTGAARARFSPFDPRVLAAVGRPTVDRITLHRVE